MSAFVDRSGQRFGHLVVVSLVGIRAHRARWLVRCDCGATKELLGQALASGQAKHCNATHHRSEALRGKSTTHGMSRSTEYEIWTGMRGRCLNPRDQAFPRYGGRGISVCARWSSFEVFFADMGPRPAGKSLDRKDNDGPYSPENCRWATAVEQSNNKRTNRLTADGRTVAQFARDEGLKYPTAYYRTTLAKDHLATIERPDQLTWE